MNTGRIDGHPQAKANVSGSVSASGALGGITIRGVTITRTEGAKLYVDTTANWDLQTEYVPEKGVIIVYTDHTLIDDGMGNVTYVPGLKIGDGNAYLIDLPFIDDATTDRLLAHMNDASAHVSPEERAFWNNKLNYDMNGETLSLNRD